MGTHRTQKFMIDWNQSAEDQIFGYYNRTGHRATPVATELQARCNATGLEPRCSVEWQPQARFSTHQVGSLHRRRKLRGTQFRPPDTFFGFARRNGVDHVLHEALPRTAIERFGPAGATPPRCPPFLLVAIRINIPKRTAHGSRNPSCFDPEAPGHIIT